MYFTVNFVFVHFNPRGISKRQDDGCSQASGLLSSAKALGAKKTFSLFPHELTPAALVSFATDILATNLPMLLKCSLFPPRTQETDTSMSLPDTKGHHGLHGQIPLPPGSQYKRPQLL